MKQRMYQTNDDRQLVSLWQLLDMTDWSDDEMEQIVTLKPGQRVVIAEGFDHPFTITRKEDLES